MAFSKLKSADEKNQQSRIGSVVSGLTQGANDVFFQPLKRSLQNIGTATATLGQAGVASAVSRFNPQLAAQIASQDFLGTQSRANNIISNPRQSLTQQIGDSISLGLTAYGGSGITGTAPRILPGIINKTLPQIGRGTLFGTTAISGGLNAAIEGLTGGNAYEGFGQGLAQGPKYTAINQLTAPGVNSILNRTSNLTSANKILARAPILGGVNVGEGILDSISRGQNYGSNDFLLDFGVGAIASPLAKADNLSGRQGRSPSLNKRFEEATAPVRNFFENFGKQTEEAVENAKKTRFLSELEFPQSGPVGKTGDTIRISGGRDLVPSGGGLGKESAAGLIAGFEPQYDEEGNLVGYEYNSTKGALGLGLMAGTKSVRDNINRTKLSGVQLDIPTRKLVDPNAKLEPEEWTSLLNQKTKIAETSTQSPANLQAAVAIQDRVRDLRKTSVDRIGKLPKTLETESLTKSQLVEEADSLIDTINKAEINVKEKVNLLDYLRTPDRVLKKIGLGREAKLIRRQYDRYLDELPKQIDRITAWSKQVPEESNQRIFQFLDGQKIELNEQELNVANEVRDYLEEWADRLHLPRDKRVSHYITHIFEKDFIEKEFDPAVAKIIRDRVAGSVYDPFLEKRLGKLGYIEDTWQALDAYVKRATRKVHMDPILKEVQDKAANLEESQYQFVKSYTDRINMRPTTIDNLLDNTVKSIVGYQFGQRPTAYLSRKGRQMIYRGALGLNVGSALKNLSQGANTYAKLGEKYTVIGYLDLVKKGTKELEEVGVLRNGFIEDRVLSAKKQLLQKADTGLFSIFETAEKINRGSAYYGAKAKALSKGMSEEEAIDFAKKIVRDTQFTFGSVDTPVFMQSDLVKIATQFQSFTVKQTEFLAEMVKKKEYAGLIRYSGASLAFVYTVGQLMGMEPKDIIPSFRFSPPPLTNLPLETGKAILNTPDRYGNERDLSDKVRDIGKAAVPFIPAGVQLKKSIQGLDAAQQGYSETQSGRVRYPIDQTPASTARSAIFGQYSSPEARQYFDENRSPLGPSQSEKFKSLSPDSRVQYYNSVIENRDSKDEKTGLMAEIGKLLDPGNEVSAAMELPSRYSDIEIVHDRALSVVNNYARKSAEARVDGESLEPLQQELVEAKQILERIKEERPEQYYKLQFDTYGKGGNQDVETRGNWAVEEIQALDPSERQAFVNRLWEEGVLTTGSRGVAQFIKDTYGVDLTKYTGNNSKIKNKVGGKGKSPKAPRIKLSALPRSRKITLGGTGGSSRFKLTDIKSKPISAPRIRV